MGGPAVGARVFNSSTSVGCAGAVPADFERGLAGLELADSGMRSWKGRRGSASFQFRPAANRPSDAGFSAIRGRPRALPTGKVRD